jgi:hypothetical protein
VTRFAAELDAFDVEELLPVELIADASASIRSASRRVLKNSITCSISELTTPQTTIAA